MSTLESQYKSYLKENPDSKLSFEEWKKQLVFKVKQNTDFTNEMEDWDVTLMDGLEDEEF